MLLPDWNPITTVEVAPVQIRITYNSPGLFPLQKLPDGRLVVDGWSGAPRRVEVVRTGPEGQRRVVPKLLPSPLRYMRVWRREDHPNIHMLPKHCPRVVRSLYRAETQLRLIRSVHYDSTFWDEIEDAWMAFIRNSGAS
jgi:hypothetical protein